jgi:putative nucleotidyltransferase with HDIG domain
MIEWLKRQALVRRGLSCGKTRRTNPEEELRELFDRHPLVRGIILLLTFAGLYRVGSWGSAAADGEILLLSGMVIAISFIVIPLSSKEVWNNNHLLLLFLGCLVVNLFVNKGLILLGEDERFKFIETSLPALLVPSALSPMLITILVSPSAGFVSAFLIAILGNLFVNHDSGLLLSSLLTGFSATFFSQKIRRRSDILMAGVKVGLVGLCCSALLSWLTDPSLDRMLVQSIWAIFFGVGTSFVISFLLPVLEWLFDRITDISWLELADLNHPLLKRLYDEAPGTYHHSLNVANLAEAAAETIGANRSMCRVCSYFHDIGKLAKPDYFVENYTSEADPHKQLAPSMSALIIIAHVKEGISLALKHGLRQPIIDVIQQHHGTSLVYYFYKRALQQQQDAREGTKILGTREEDVPEVDERSFRYPGPIPQNRESAIISLADAIESSSRSLKQPTSQRIDTLVEEIVGSRAKEGQLDESQLTFNEVSALIESFSFTLKKMLHARIEYPKERGQGKPAQPPKKVPAPPEQTPAAG